MSDKLINIGVIILPQSLDILLFIISIIYGILQFSFCQPKPPELTVTVVHSTICINTFVTTLMFLSLRILNTMLLYGHKY